MELDLDFLDTVISELDGLAQQNEAAVAVSGKPRIRVRAGGVVTDAMLAEALGIELPKPVEVLRKRLNLDQLHLVPGMICPRCQGSGKSEWGTCFWCTAESKPRQSWGVLSPKDIMLINSRRESRRAVCDVIAA